MNAFPQLRIQTKCFGSKKNEAGNIIHTILKPTNDIKGLLKISGKPMGTLSGCYKTRKTRVHS